MNKTPVVHACWAAAAAAAFFVGSRSSTPGLSPGGEEFGDGNTGTPPGLSGLSRLSEDREGGRARLGERVAGAGSASELEKLFGSAALAAGGIDELALEAFDNPNPVARRLAFGRLLAEMTPENASEIREQLVELGADGDQWRDFHYSWGAIAGREAFDNAAETDERDLDATLTGWAAANPNDALAMLENLPEDMQGQRERLAESVVTGLADTDPTLATSLVLQMAAEGSDRADNMIRTVANEMLRGGDVAAASRWSENLPDGPVKGAAMDRVAGSFVREDPEAAAAWIETYADSDYAARAVAEVGGEWAERDPQSAVSWLEGLPEGNGRNSGMSSAFGDWEDSDPTAASEYLASLSPSPMRDSAIAGFSQGIAWQDPQSALAWAQDISDPGIRERSLTQVGQAYFRRDPEGARAWLESSGLSPEAREQVVNPRRR